MAKSVKKAVKKTVAKKVVAKKAVAKKAVKQVAKKVLKKVAKKAPQKTVKKVAKKTAPKAPVKRAGKKFLIVYHAPFEAMAQMANIPPEQQAAGMALWLEWIKRVGNNLVDVGAPLINGKSLQSSGSSSPSSKEVSGYSLVIAEDWDEVMSLLEGHPHLSGWHPEATIEIHETMLLPGM
jgi:hypothetical protein